MRWELQLPALALGLLDVAGAGWMQRRDCLVSVSGDVPGICVTMGGLRTPGT